MDHARGSIRPAGSWSSEPTPIRGRGITANSRMSPLACLGHELAHVERYELGYDRPFALPDSLFDEAETSLRASFIPVLGARDREDLVEDARDRLIDWLATRTQDST